ncbi:formate/nitrite transporter family protein [Proteiniborus sp. MB09-C3]|uniref:formate/nitrite transporter family protein n=1 Tax=Proteiniborus sp. MB09-C3 TaxID=3050072 RepID=UPI0025536FC3|nr:formate/nitrite transporter family protein [Proteiniborus sp. MB09-C3]WIV13420.1 formate/nitrite transporter family protein [Proteiniborus sp. MB09-C3]
MEKRYLAPSEVAQAIIASSETKASLSITRMLILGIMAGIYIGLGGYAYIVVMQTLGNIDAGLMKFFGAFVFPVGLMLVVFSGSELFTGNNLMTMGLMDKKITLTGMLKNWIFVYIGNFIGSVILAYIIYKSQLVSKDILATTLDLGLAKTSLSFQAAFLRGVLCNILVVLAVWTASASLDIGSRILSVWFPVMLFILSGFEHCVANMFTLPLARFSGLNITWSHIWITNLIPVTLGNIVGGGIIIPVAYYITYILPAKKDSQ